ncbi:NTF2 fold immunity protein [Paraflavitalea speifideaquila]|uniref:NTF2 fold immunity protein n=1 Tax=Paraflavitalea speifideaquila TaxID=3076558 RepID=UPI00331302E9
MPIYGDDVLKQKPYKVHLIKDSIWIVEGALKPNYSGGVAYIEIRKSNSTILKVTHGK